MKWSGQIWSVALAALMTLAVSLVWPPLGSEAASSTNHAPITALERHQTHAEEISPPLVRHVSLDADCQPSAFGCCAMTHCHPAISVDAHQMTNVVAAGETTTTAAARHSSSDPGVNLPPPRRLLV